jgi:hemerythrin-like metal-binding protein
MTALFNWNTQDFSVWVQAMDDEHIKLIGIMNRLHERHQQNAPRPETVALLTELVSYTQKHFADEEKYLDSIDFPERKVHKIIHVQLMDKLKNFADAHTKGQALKASMERRAVAKPKLADPEVARRSLDGLPSGERKLA